MHEALIWGEVHLGLRRDAIITNGASRGGHAAMVLGSRLAVMEGNHVRGIFVTVFGTMAAETMVSPELVRRLCWDWAPTGDAGAAAAAIQAVLSGGGARPWQRELVVPALAAALTSSD